MAGLASRVAGADEIAAFVAVDLPDPRRLAGILTVYYPAMARALLSARRTENGYWIDHSAEADELRSAGLVEARGQYLGAFGLAVRRSLVRMREVNDDTPDEL